MGTNSGHDALLEAYGRLHRYGPEFGGDEEGNHGLTNHGPMAVEVLTRRGVDVDITGWLDRYVPRLQDLPAPAVPITDEDWLDALGTPRRLPDWTEWFQRRLREQPWTDVLATWWPRLLPGIVAGSTHGVIRVGHAVRTLTGPGGPADAADAAGEPGGFGVPAAAEEPALDELAHGLAFWAARYRPLPGAAAPDGTASTVDAFHAIPRLADQSGFIAHRVGRLAATPGWSAGLRALRPATADEVPARLAELVDVATRAYPRYGRAAPVLLVHTATAPNAVRHTLPALPRELWPASFYAAWAAAAAIVAAYAPPVPIEDRPAERFADETDPAADAMARAAAHGDEHVIKFTDTAIDAFDRTGNPELLAAASHVGKLIGPPG